MIRLLRSLGVLALDRLASLGRASVMWGQSVWGLPRAGDLPLLVRQIYSIGVLSLIIIVLSAFSIGAVIALQFYTQLQRFGAEDAVGLGLALARNWATLLGGRLELAARHHPQYGGAHFRLTIPARLQT